MKPNTIDSDWAIRGSKEQFRVTAPNTMSHPTVAMSDGGAGSGGLRVHRVSADRGRITSTSR
jgi:hypothetical protein